MPRLKEHRQVVCELGRGFLSWATLGCLLAVCMAVPLAAQSHLYTWKADDVGQYFGAAIAAAGDVDADGYDDVITAMGWSRSQTTQGSCARVLSGRDGHPLFDIVDQGGGSGAVCSAGDLDLDGHADLGLVDYDKARSKWELWIVSGKTQKRLRTTILYGAVSANALAPAGDVDKDGYPDLLVGDSQYNGGGTTHGRVLVVSGKDGSFLHDLRPTNTKNFGWSVAHAGDVDQDGYADFLVGDPYFGTILPNFGPGQARLISGKTGKTLWTLSPPASPKYLSSGFGSSVCGIDDLDGDRVPDLAIGACWSDTGAIDGGEVFVFSGRTGLQIRGMVGSTASLLLGASMAPVGDWNGDGVTDLAVGAPGFNSPFPRSGAVQVYSGKDSKFLWSKAGKSQNQALGWSVAHAGDLDGDGRADLLVGMLEITHGPLQLTAEMSAWSPANKSLWSDTHEVSLKSQGQQQLQLDAGSQHAGSTYLLLGSMSGIQPGLQLGSHLLPLQVDSYFWLTATLPNSSFLQGSLGLLDSQGQAKASFTAVAGMPQALIGQRADHAYVVFGKGGFTMTSNWVPLLFAK